MGSRTHAGTVVPRLSRPWRGRRWKPWGLDLLTATAMALHLSRAPCLAVVPVPAVPSLALLAQKTHQALRASLGWVMDVPACAGGWCLVCVVLAEDMSLEAPAQATCRVFQGWCHLGGVRAWAQLVLRGPQDRCGAASGQGGMDPAPVLALSHSPCCALVHHS